MLQQIPLIQMLQQGIERAHRIMRTSPNTGLFFIRCLRQTCSFIQLLQFIDVNYLTSQKFFDHLFLTVKTRSHTHLVILVIFLICAARKAFPNRKNKYDTFEQTMRGTRLSWCKQRKLEEGVASLLVGNRL